jgi:hypothetical protein
MYQEIDIDFIEFYIKKKYNKTLYDYFNVSRPIASTWRNKKFPDSRLMEFCRNEKTLDILELFNNLYKK